MSTDNEALPPLPEALKRAYYYTELGGWHGPEVDESERWASVAEAARAALAQRQQVPAITDAMVEAAKSAYQAGYNVEPYALRIRLTLEAALTAAPPVQQQSEPRADDEGRCTRCGLPFEDPAELQHECPQDSRSPPRSSRAHSQSSSLWRGACEALGRSAGK